jgi:hypothetical protein
MHGAKKIKTTNTAHFTDCTHNWNTRRPTPWHSLIQMSIRTLLEKTNTDEQTGNKGQQTVGGRHFVPPSPVEICNILRRLWKCLLKYSISFTSPISVLPTLLALGSRSYARKVTRWKYRMFYDCRLKPFTINQDFAGQYENNMRKFSSGNKNARHWTTLLYCGVYAVHHELINGVTSNVLTPVRAKRTVKYFISII